MTGALVTALDDLASALLAAFPPPVVVADGSHQGNVRAGLMPCSTCKTLQRSGAVHFAALADQRPCPGSWGGQMTARIEAQRTHATGEFCALCTSDVGGQPEHREPLGRNGALVNVCIRCATEPIVERDHLFGGTAHDGPVAAVHAGFQRGSSRGSGRKAGAQ